MRPSRGWAALLLLGGCGGAPAAQAPTVDVGGAPPPPSAAPSVEARTAPQPAERGATPDARAADLGKEQDQLEVAMLGALSTSQAGPSAVLQGGTGLPSGAGGLAVGSWGAGSAPLPGPTQTVKGPLVGVQVGRVTVVGTVANAAAVGAGMRPAFRRCLQHALTHDPGAVRPGTTLRLQATVGAQGEVTAAKVVGPTGGLPAPTLACLVARVRAAQFSPPDGGSATVEIPLTADVSIP